MYYRFYINLYLLYAHKKIQLVGIGGFCAIEGVVSAEKIRFWDQNMYQLEFLLYEAIILVTPS